MLNINRWTVCVYGFAFLSSVYVSAGTSLRTQIDLNTDWEYLPVKGSSLTPPGSDATGWTKVTIPHTGSGRAWYRKLVTIPADRSAGRVELYFESVGTHTKVFVNGRLADENWYFMTPWSTDVTPYIKFGQANEILVGVEDADTGAGTKGGKPWSVPGIWIYGGTTAGFYHGAELRTHPSVYVADAFIQPSWRKKTLKVTYTLTNKTNAVSKFNLQATVVNDKDQPELSLDPVSIELPAGSAKTIVVEKAWPNPHLWFPHDPYLYHLKTELKQPNQTIDETKTRFGFCELWIDKTEFRCNGVRAPIRRTSESLPYLGNAQYDRGRMREYMKERKSMGINCFRSHSLPMPEYMLDICDELGMMVVQEGDMWMHPSTYTFNGPFWDRFVEHWRRIVLYCRNHPCLFGYSIANESFPQEIWGDRTTMIYKEFHRAAAMIFKMDPGRIVENSSGDDQSGDLAVRNWHYPNDLAARWQLPNCAWWLKSNAYQGSSEKPGHRDKPLIVGEEFNDTFRGPNGSYVAYGGEDYYLAGPNYRMNPIYVTEKRVVTDIYRLSNIASINPADPCVKPWEGKIIPPVTLLRRDYRQHFFSGTNVEIPYTVANEEWKPQKLSITWQLMGEGETAATLAETRDYDMPAGELKPITFMFKTPSLEARKNYQLKVTVKADSQVADEWSQRICVFPKRPLKVNPALRIGGYDPSKAFTQMLTEAGISNLIPVSSIDPSHLKNIDVLLVGPNQSKNEIVDADYLTAFFGSGGRMVVFEQKPSGLKVKLSGLDIDFTGQTIVFPGRFDHPILRNVEATDLRWWDKDHWVCTGSYSIDRPGRGNFRTIVDASDPVGLRYSPMLEQFTGNGRIVLSQLRVGELFDREPMARALLQNLLDYLNEPVPAPTATALIAADKSELANALDVMKLNYATVKGETENLTRFGLIIADADALSKSPGLAMKIKSFVENGGNLLLRSLTPKNAVCLERLAGVKPILKEIKPYQCVRISQDPLTFGINQYDLWWRAGNWSMNTDGTQVIMRLCDFVLETIPRATPYIVAVPQWMGVDEAAKEQLKKNSVALAALPAGKGKIIIDQLNWHRPMGMAVGNKYAVTLLGNMNADFSRKIYKDAALPVEAYTPLSLKGVINQPLNAEVGSRRPKVFGLNNLAQIPNGTAVPLKGVPFNISGLVTLRSKEHAPNYPDTVTGIPCGKKVAKLHFLHGVGWAGSPGETVLTYVIHYQDKTSARVEVVQGVHVMEWWSVPVPLKGAALAWEGRNEMHAPVCVYRMEWKNPKPDVPVETIDLVNGKTGAIPFVIGITVENAK